MDSHIGSPSRLNSGDLWPRLKPFRTQPPKPTPQTAAAARIRTSRHPRPGAESFGILNQAKLADRPRLISDNRFSYVAGTWPNGSVPANQAPSLYAPSSDEQGKIEHWHQTLKNRILLEKFYLPGDLDAQQLSAYERACRPGVSGVATRRGR